MYINIDSDYNVNVLSDSRKWNVYRVAYFNNGAWNTVPNAPTYLRSFNLTDYASDGSNITMGYVCGSKIVIDFKNAPTTLANSLTEGTQIILYLSLKGNENQTSSSQLSTVPYVIDETKIVPIMNGRNITVTAYDLSYLMTHEYVSAFENPTALEIVTEIATKYNLTVDVSVSQKIAELGSSLSGLTFKPLSGFTCKQTLGYIAGCFGCNARVGTGRKIYFEWFENSSMPDINNNVVYLGGSTLSERFIVKMIETGTSDNPIVYPDNANGYSINFENPYITADLARLIYENKIANNKISFRSGKVKYKGNPINTSGKIVTTTDINNVAVNFYIMKRTLNYNGGLSETIESFGESETTINYKINSPTQQRIDRALSKMEDAIKKSTDVITQTQGSTFELIPVDANDATQGNAGFKIHYEDTGSSAFDDCVIMGTAGGVGLSTNNGETFATAMYFYEDEDTGEIHGAINGEVIRVGSISADKIDTSQLVVSKENVDGLDAELAELLEVANEADKKAGNAEKTANTASSTASTANTNASNALSVANSANGKVASWASSHNTTLIDGAKIYTGSITAEQIAAGAISADKLNVGVAKRSNIMFNPEFNVVSDNTLEGWNAISGELTPQQGGWIKFKPSTTSYTGFYQDVWLKPGRYALVTRVNFYGVSRVDEDAAICLILNNKFNVFENEQILGNTWYKNKNEEMVVKQVFDYTGAEGFVSVGFGMFGFTFSNYLSSAWCALHETANEKTGFYSSNTNILSSNYKQSNVLVYKHEMEDNIPSDKAMGVDSENGLVVIGGKIGAFDFSKNTLSAELHVPFTNYPGGINSYFEIGASSGGVFDSVNTSSYLDAARTLYTHIEFSSSTDNLSLMCPEYVYCGNASESQYSVMTPTRIKTTDIEAETATIEEIGVDELTVSGALVVGATSANANITVNGRVITQSNRFEGLEHQRAGFGSIKVGVGQISNKSTAALELLGTDGTRSARLDVYDRGQTNSRGTLIVNNDDGSSSPLDIGVDDMWLNGKPIFSTLDIHTSKLNSLPATIDIGQKADVPIDNTWVLVSFNKTFSSAPKVVCSVEQKYSGTDETYSVCVGETTKTGFNVKLKRTSGDLGYNCSINWIAIA